MSDRVADSLREIRERAQEVQEALRGTDDYGYGYEHMGDMARDLGPLAADVLALVEVAEAAQAFSAAMPRHGVDAGALYQERVDDAIDALEAALSKLGGTQ